MTLAEFEQLCEDARAVMSTWSAAQLAHHHHAQRVSWVSGNLLLGHDEMTREQAEEHARRAAGTCPCDDCLLARATEARPTRPISQPMLDALADASREDPT